MPRMKRTRAALGLFPAYVMLVSAAALTAQISWAADAPAGKIASIQNLVETRHHNDGGWQPSIMNEPLSALDRIRTGPASRAAVLYADQTLHRINERSEVEIRPPDGDTPGVLRVISGTHYFSSRRPKDYGRIQTPTVTAAIRGTEFVVEVVDGGATTITMLEGVVEASNDLGSLSVTSGEQAYVAPGTAPVKRIVVRPRDAVAWSLYYPRVLGPADRKRLGAAGVEGENLSRAADLLASGQVGQAAPLIESARKSRPDDPVALALASVIEVAGGRGDEAVRLAEQAVAADGSSAAAALSLSFAAQSRFDIARARSMAETAARLSPDSAEAQSRIAELRMAEGDIRGASEAARDAVRLDPHSARALTVSGFVQLAEMRSAEALDTFERAVSADPTYPEAHLGFGIATIRRGHLEAGREKMQTAAVLDPDNALIRSYLAKAYYEEKRESESLKELALAQELDPSDPTPHLYDAILKKTYNRPVEALSSLRQSIELNDRRAVYRSRLLLDQDLAVRSADLAGIYNDLGFEQLGMVAARRSADAEQSNYSSHLFLAGNYRELPGFASAFLSEVLQARIYQPVNVNAVRPDVVNETVSFNEYTSLIDQPRLRGYFGASYGVTDTDLADLFEGQTCGPPGAPVPCEETIELNDSNSDGFDATVTYNQDKFAGSLSFNSYDDDGFRVNNQQSNDVMRGFIAWSPTSRDHLQLNVIDGNRNTGDFPLRSIPAATTPEELETDQTNVALGYRRVLSPSQDLVVSAIYNDTEQFGDFPTPFDQTVTATLSGPQLETQYVQRLAKQTWIAGAGHFQGEQEVEGESVLGDVRFTGDDTFTNGYVYAKFRHVGPVEITAGASYEAVDAPVGLLPPRDSVILASEVSHDDSMVSPKLGVTWYATGKTVLRAGAFYRLNPALGRLQTLEPTQIAGFNQIFNDPGGTRSLNYGAGVDQEFARNFFAGVSVLRRDLEIPEAFCDTPGDFAGCVGQVSTHVEERSSDDWLGNVYINGTIGPRLALSLEYAYEERDFDFTQNDPTGAFEDYVETQRLRPEVRLFFPSGIFAGVRATRYDQVIGVQPFYLETPAAPREEVESDFWIADLRAGYRFPDRLGSVALDVLNVADEEFVLFRSSLEERLYPARTVLLSARFAY